MNEIPQFGQRLGDGPYAERPSAYGLLLNPDGLLLVCRTPKRLVLPGGGIDPGETPEQAMIREIAEESGLVVTTAQLFCRADQYVERDRPKSGVNKTGWFYRTSYQDRGGQPVDDDHELLWLSLEEASEQLDHEAQRWVVKELAAADQGSVAATRGGRPC